MFGDEKALTLDLHCHNKHIIKELGRTKLLCGKKVGKSS
jgi:hypothetical protein